MLNHTKKIKEIYEVIQKMIFYMIPEKWDKLYLYSSVIDKPDGNKTGELYFYYIPKGIIKKKPINVYEIPNKFNVDENEYLKLVKALYENIQKLREQFRKSERGTIWSNVTIIIENYKFKVEYNYEDLLQSDFNSYERHIIWRYKYLNVKPEQMNKKDKEIINRYLLGAKLLSRTEKYEAGIYIKDIENIVAFNTTKENEEIRVKEKQYKEDQLKKEENKIRKNQILFATEEKYSKQENKKNIEKEKQIQNKENKIRKNQILFATEKIEKSQDKKGGN